jgi:hypothetical protein
MFFQEASQSQSQSQEKCFTGLIGLILVRNIADSFLLGFSEDCSCVLFKQERVNIYRYSSIEII